MIDKQNGGPEQLANLNLVSEQNGEQNASRHLKKKSMTMQEVKDMGNDYLKQTSKRYNSSAMLKKMLDQGIISSSTEVNSLGNVIEGRAQKEEKMAASYVGSKSKATEKLSIVDSDIQRIKSMEAKFTALDYLEANKSNGIKIKPNTSLSSQPSIHNRKSSKYKLV